MEIFILWLIFSIVVAAVGNTRKIGFGLAFLWSLLLSPLLGLIIVFASDKKTDIEAREKQEAELKAIKQNTAKSMTDQIKSAKDLFDSGALTQEEFDTLKQKILNSDIENVSDDIVKTAFVEEDIVINKNTGLKMRVGRINYNGTYKCFKIGEVYAEGDFREDELKYSDADLPRFRVGDLVVDKRTQTQMKIEKVNKDGTYQCFKNGGLTYLGDFSDYDIRLFKNYI